MSMFVRTSEKLGQVSDTGQPLATLPRVHIFQYAAVQY